jgi:hypothetical protein
MNAVPHRSAHESTSEAVGLDLSAIPEAVCTAIMQHKEQINAAGRVTKCKQSNTHIEFHVQATGGWDCGICSETHRSNNFKILYAIQTGRIELFCMKAHVLQLLGEVQEHQGQPAATVEELAVDVNEKNNLVVLHRIHCKTYQWDIGCFTTQMGYYWHQRRCQTLKNGRHH